MNLSDIFRSFLGLSRNPPGADGSGFQNDFRNPIWNVDDEDDTDDELHHNFGGGNGNFSSGFHVFTNPLEMHRYFEQQMEDILKSFGGMMGTFGHLSPPGHEALPNFSLPAIKGKEPGNIRDEYLKPGYRSLDSNAQNNKIDSDIDGKVTSDDLNSLFDKKMEGTIQPAEKYPKSSDKKPFFYGQTFVRKSVVLPDGSIETTETIKNSDGRDETTVTISPGSGPQEGGPDMGLLTQPFDNMWRNFFGS